MIDQRGPRAHLISVFALALVVSLSGCQVLSPSSLPPNLTPILLDPQEAAAQPAIAREAIATAPTTPATPPPGQLSPIVVPETAPTSAPSGGILALGTRATLVLRALPGPTAETVAQVPGSQVLRAQGRNADGSWLWVVYDEAGQKAWVAAQDVKLMGDALRLTEVQAAAAALAPGPLPVTAVAAPSPTRQPASAAPRGGKIVFQTAVGGDIYLANADGTGLRRVADGFDPALSPDGTQLAFVRWGTPDGLYLLDLRTGQERQLTIAQRPRGPAWSPDGTRIVFSHNTLLATCLDTPLGCLSEQEVQLLFNGQACINTFQGRICLADYPLRQIEKTALVLLTLADGSKLDLPSQERAQSPAWHPQQDEILYNGEAGLQIVPLGEATRPLVNDATLGSPAWAPNGQHIVAQAYKHDHWDIVLLDAAGSTLAQLTMPGPLSWQKPNNVAPAWAPDGRSILFLSDRDGAWRVYRMNVDGSQQMLFLPQTLGRITLSYDFAAERVMSWSK